MTPEALETATPPTAHGKTERDSVKKMLDAPVMHF